jgi:hypothetical protein
MVNTELIGIDPKDYIGRDLSTLSREELEKIDQAYKKALKGGAPNGSVWESLGQKVTLLISADLSNVPRNLLQGGFVFESKKDDIGA